MTAAPNASGPILLITDLSPRCDRAMDRAVAMAQAHNLPLIALSVMDTPWLTKLATPAWRSLQQDNLAQAQKRLLKDLSPAITQGHVKVDVLVETGNPVEIIARVANEHQCSLIVSGTARDETLGRVVLGNTVERLARRTTIPLLVVRARPFASYATVVVATDFSEGSKHALAVAHGLCRDAAFTLYHAFDEVAGIYALDQPTVQEQAKALKKKATAFVHATPGLESTELPAVIEHGVAAQQLPAYVESNEIELVVMGTHGATGILRTAMGSVAEQLLATLLCDVLIVPQA